MALTVEEQVKLDNMCPSAKRALLGTTIRNAASAQNMAMPLPGTLGSDVGVGGTVYGLPVATLPGAATYLPFVGHYDTGESAGSKLVDDTADAASAGASDVLVWPAAPAVGDSFLIGAAFPFHGVLINVGTKMVSEDMTAVWKYSDSGVDPSAWTAIPAATLNDATLTMLVDATGSVLLTFAPPSDWTAVILDGGSVEPLAKYWIACDITVFTSLGTNPLVTQLWTYHAGTMSGTAAIATGNVTAIDFNFNTASGSTADSTFVLANITQGTYQTYNKTKATVFEAVAATLAITLGDELALIQVSEDGSTEFANGSATLIIAPTE